MLRLKPSLWCPIVNFSRILYGNIIFYKANYSYNTVQCTSETEDKRTLVSLFAVSITRPCRHAIYLFIKSPEDLSFFLSFGRQLFLLLAVGCYLLQLLAVGCLLIIFL